MKNLLAAGIFILGMQFTTCFQTAKEPGEISGRMSPAPTNAPSMEVLLLNPKTAEQVDSTSSETNGTFRFSNVDPGKYMVKIIDPDSGDALFRKEVEVSSGESAIVTIERDNMGR